MVCHLLGSGFNYAIQILLGLFAFGILSLKYWKESPRRLLHVWVKDVSKQIIGMLWAHTLNILLAILLQEDQDQCLSYFVNFLVDNSLGILLNILLLYTTKWIGQKYHIATLQTGHYEDIDNKELVNSIIKKTNKFKCIGRSSIMWIKQLCIWIFIVSIVKIFLFFCFVIPLKNNLLSFGSTILYGITRNDQCELVIVMIITPLIFNTLQFLIQDHCLKFKQNQPLSGLDINNESDDINVSFESII